MNSNDRDDPEKRRKAVIRRLTEGREVGTFREKRTIGQQFLKAEIIPARIDMKPFPVSISDEERAAGGYVVASNVEFPELDRVDVILRTRRGEMVELSGRVEVARRGRRSEDLKQQQPIYYSVFHPKTPWKR